MFHKTLIGLLTLLILATSLSNCAPTSDDKSDQLRAKKIVVNNQNGDPIDIYDNSFVVSDDEGKLFSYDPLAKRLIDYQSLSEVRQSDNMVSKPLLNLERESSVGRSVSKAKSLQDGRVAASSAESGGAAESAQPDSEKYGSIAFNSREVRLVGPNQKEVEMKDDVASKMVVALENLQKEATDVWDQVNDKLDKGWKDLKRSEVWGQVNEKLDKGWVDFKSMVEGVVAPSTKRQP